MAKSSKLHELLAVKTTKEGEIDALLKEHMSTFKDKHQLFKKSKTVFTPNSEKEGELAQPVVEDETPLVTTVAKEAGFIFNKFAETIDLLHTIDLANCEAKADIVVDGEVFATGVPSTFLVHLEKRFNQIIKLIESIPTADPAMGFAPDNSMGANVLQASPIVRHRTSKIEEFLTVVPATKEHAAQVVKQVKDVVVGNVTKYQWTSLPTTHQKSELIERAIKLKNAVVEARARANCHAIEQKRIFGPMKDYILYPLS
jgi:hypothetical protein